MRAHAIPYATASALTWSSARRYHDQGKLQEAEAMYNYSLDIVLDIHGSKRPHPDAAELYNELGVVYLLDGKHKEAEEMITKCFDMMLAIYQPTALHPSIARTLPGT